MGPEEDTQPPKVVISVDMIERAAEAHRKFRAPELASTLSAHAYDEIRMAHALAAAFNR